MLDGKELDSSALERLSALVDGELDGHGVAAACGHWREDGVARSSWHAYHVIGDVLRSDDLAGGSAGDAAFLSVLRGRMKDEPIVLAPQPTHAAVAVDAVAAHARQVAVGAEPPSVSRSRGGSFASRRWSWRTGSAVAAGFVLVAGVVTLTRGPGAAAPAVPALAQLTPPVQAIDASAIVGAPAAEPTAMVANGTLIRDARLDRYLAAHKQFAGSSALSLPSGLLRNATAVESAR